MLEWNFDEPKIEWFKGARLNITESCLDRHLFEKADKPAIIWEANRPDEPSRVFTYLQLHQEVGKLANVLVKHGIKKGDRIALYMPMVPELAIAVLACARVGAIHSVVFAGFSANSLVDRITDSGVKLVLTSDGMFRGPKALPVKSVVDDALENCPTVEKCLVLKRTGEAVGMKPGRDFWYHEEMNSSSVDFPAVETDAEDLLFILYTSGSTGKPKGALGSHRNLLTNGLSSAYSGAATVLRRGDALPEPSIRASLLVIPMFHVTACSASMMPTIQAGHKIVLLHKWDTVKAFEIIEREKINATGGVPFIAWQLIEHPDRAKYDLSSIDAISYGGAPSAPELVSKIYEIFGAFPGNGWGMTETMATVTSHVAEDYLNRPDSCGPAVAVSDLKIMSEDGATELPIGEVGELWARGPQIVKGYWNRPDATADTFVDGWVRTGDLARVDDEGFCFIVDRAKDMIIRGGENIYSSEVENILYEHPAVTDAALVGIPHQTLGEEPAAVVHLAPGASATEGELRAWVSARLAKFKVPVKIIFTQDTLPRNANGKILKRELKALF